MTPQEAFDLVSVHLLKQNKACSAGRAMRYRHEGLSDPIGLVMTNYFPAMEGLAWWKIRQLGLHPALGCDSTLEGLQTIHDFTPPSKWKKALAHFAQKHHLNLSKEFAEL